MIIDVPKICHQIIGYCLYLDIVAIHVSELSQVDLGGALKCILHLGGNSSIPFDQLHTYCLSKSSCNSDLPYKQV